MSRPGLLEALKVRPLLGDGAMGTQLQLVGLEPGACGEMWNLEHPDRVLAIQKAYADAGSDCLITNTFGGCRLTLTRHGFQGKVKEINQAAVRIAREALGAKPGYVLGDIGPFGGLMEPLGEVPEEEVRSAFTEQAQALVEAGVDALILETQTSLEELGVAVEVAKAVGAPCVIGSMAFDVMRDGSEARTMMGVNAEKAARFMQERGVDIVALNCGTGINVEWATRLTARYRKACALPIMAQPNAGDPHLEGDRVVYRQEPQAMALGISALCAAGARIIGACCGSTPAHIRCFRQQLDALSASGRAS